MKQMKLFSLTWPIFIETLLFMGLGIVDTYMLSKYSDFAAGAIGATTQITSFVNLLFMIIAGGAIVLLAQYLGARDRKSAQEVMSVALVMNLVVGLIISGVLLFVGDDLLRLIRLTPDLMPHALIYIKIVGGFMFLQALNATLSGFMRTHGHTKQSMYISVFMNVLNVLGDAILIFGWFGLPAMGAKGVAIATVFSSFIATIIFIIYTLKNIIKPRAFLHILSFPTKTISKLLKIGLPTAAEGLSFNLTDIALTAMLFLTLGQESVIARAYISKITLIAIVFSFSIGQGTQIMVGHRIGAKDNKGAYKVGLRNFYYALGLTAIAGLCIIIFSKSLIGIFTTDATIIAIGAQSLVILGFLEPGRAFNIVFVRALKGAGDIYFSVIICIISGWGFRIGIGYLLGVTLGYGLAGFIFASLLDEWIRGFIMFIRWKSFKWTKYSLVAEKSD